MNVWNWIYGIVERGISRIRKWFHPEESLLDSHTQSEQVASLYPESQNVTPDECIINIEPYNYTDLEKHLKGSVLWKYFDFISGFISNKGQSKSYWNDFFSRYKSYGDSNYGKRHGMTIMLSDTKTYMGYVTYDNGKRDGPFMALVELFPSCTLVVTGQYRNDSVSFFTASNEDICFTYKGPSDYSLKFSKGYNYPV